MIFPTSREIARITHLRSFLRERDVIVGWGLKPSGVKARVLAEKRNLQWLLLEDGFLRSVGRHAPPISLIVDDQGVYYDAATPCRLEGLIPLPLSQEQITRASMLMSAWQQAQVSKYNHAPEYAAALPDRYVLVIDQTFGDESIAGGQAGPSSFETMLNAALDENPDSIALVKVHPDTFSHGKKGYFDINRLRANPRVKIVPESCHPVRLIRESEAVYVVTSQVGFEGLIWGKRVRCFGMPFYAGWGLTEDQLPPPSRRRKVSIEQLVHGALIAGPRYINPDTGERWEVEQALAFVAAGRQALEDKWATHGIALPLPKWRHRLQARLRFALRPS